MSHFLSIFELERVIKVYDTQLPIKKSLLFAKFVISEIMTHLSTVETVTMQ